MAKMSKTILRTGDRCPCCGQPIVTREPERLAVLRHLADEMGYGRTCGACPVAIQAAASDDAVICPFHLAADDGMDFRARHLDCDLEAVE